MIGLAFGVSKRCCDPSVVLVRTADQQLFTAQIVHAPADQRLGNIETGTELAGGVDRGIVGQKNQNIQFVGRKSFLLKAPGKFIDVDLADLRIEIQHILYRVLQRGHLLLEDIVYL